MNEASYERTILNSLKAAARRFQRDCKTWEGVGNTELSASRTNQGTNLSLYIS